MLSEGCLFKTFYARKLVGGSDRCLFVRHLVDRKDVKNIHELHQVLPVKDGAHHV